MNERVFEERQSGAHDLSSVALDANTGLPRVNMQLGLGLFLDCKRFGNGRHAEKFISDRVQRTLEGKPEQVVVDGGYISRENILDTQAHGVESMGPAMDQQAKAAQC